MRGCDPIFSVVLAASYQERWLLTLFLWHSTQEKDIGSFINLIIHLENTWIVSMFYINFQWMTSATTLQSSAFPRKEDEFPVCQGETCASNKGPIFSRIYWKRTHIIYNIMSLTHSIVYFEIFLSLFQEIN